MSYVVVKEGFFSLSVDPNKIIPKPSKKYGWVAKHIFRHSEERDLQRYQNDIDKFYKHIASNLSLRDVTCLTTLTCDHSIAIEPLNEEISTYFDDRDSCAIAREIIKTREQNCWGDRCPIFWGWDIVGMITYRYVVRRTN